MGDIVGIIDGIKSYIDDNEFKMIVLNNRILISNYSDIEHFDFDKVIINFKDKQVIIKGNNLVISKLTNNEILVTGISNNIELR